MDGVNFFALDVETANVDRSSICQIGVAEFRDGKVIDEWSTLVNPESYFDPFNIGLHGIKKSDVMDSPTFDGIYSELSERISHQIVVHHTSFDRTAINRACAEYKLQDLQIRWLDSAAICKRAWKEQFAAKGYGLAKVAEFLGIDFSHHDALEDALTAGEIVCRACVETGLSIEEWFGRVGQSIFPSKSESHLIQQQGNLDGNLYGENIVFKGTLSRPRAEMAKIAADLGCNISNGVTKKTTMLVVGIQDIPKLAGYEKSSKHRKAEELIAKDFDIKILDEKSFIEICNTNGTDLITLPLNETKSEKQLTDEVSIKVSGDKIALEVSITEEMAKGLAEIIDTLTDEEKEGMAAAYQEREDFIKSIKDCSHEDKRKLSKEIESRLEAIKEPRVDQLEEDAGAELIDDIQSEIEQIQDALFELMKNKVSLGDFFECLIDAKENISGWKEEMSVSSDVETYSASVLSELEFFEKKISEKSSP